MPVEDVDDPEELGWKSVQKNGRKMRRREQFNTVSYGLDEPDNSWWEHLPDWMRVDEKT